MINKKMQEAINSQINAEIYSSYLYLSMSSYFESINLNGFASWMRAQVQEEMDHATNNFLQWFVSEQVEEEASASGVLNKAKLIGDAPGGLFMLDRELGARVFTMPVTAGQK